jgi:hypothetical protein
MSKIMIEMDPEQVDAIIIQELNQAIDLFEQSMELRTRAGGLAVFDNDPIKDVIYIQEHISAIKLVVKYYGG